MIAAEVLKERLQPYLPENMQIINVINDDGNFTIWVRNLLNGTRHKSMFGFAEDRAIGPNLIRLMAHVIKEEVRGNL